MNALRTTFTPGVSHRWRSRLRPWLLPALFTVGLVAVLATSLHGGDPQTFALGTVALAILLAALT